MGRRALLKRDRPDLVIEINRAARRAPTDSAKAFDAYLSALSYVGRLWPVARGASVAEAAAGERINGKEGYADGLHTAAPGPLPTRSE